MHTMYIKFGEILSICSQDIERKQISGVNQRAITLVKMCQKMMCNNPNLDLVNINAYIKFGKFLSLCSQDFEPKRNFERNFDINQKP